MHGMESRETELALIGLALQDHSCAVQMAALDERIFAHVDTQAVHRAVKRQIAKGETPDMVSTAEECRGDITEPEMMLITATRVSINILPNDAKNAAL